MSENRTTQDEPVGHLLEVNGEALQRLLDYIHDQKTKRCRQILDDARQEARAILKDARARAREQVHGAVADEKLRRKREAERARANVRTRLRRRWFQIVRRELNQAWPLLQDAVINYWHASTHNRRQWLSATLDTATRTLGPGLWHLEHPEDWHREEGAAVIGALRETYEVLEIRYRPGSHGAGFHVSCSDVSVSTTVDGLLANTSRIEGMLLAKLYSDHVLTLPSVMADEEFIT